MDLSIYFEVEGKFVIEYPSWEAFEESDDQVTYFPSSIPRNRDQRDPNRRGLDCMRFREWKKILHTT